MVAQCSPDGGLMDINISQSEKGLWLLRSYPENFCNLADYHSFCFGVIFVGQPLGQPLNSGLEFPPLVHNLSDCGFLESKLFRDGFVTLSILMSNINSFSEVLSNLLCS